MKLHRTVLFLFALAGIAHAQLAQPNAQGVAAGHVHLNVSDLQAQKKFWTEVIGAQPYDKNTLTGVSTAGIIVMFRKATPTAGSIGSVVNHIGFTVPSLQ